jgi:anti-sigma regulatory factor (Ser/Thr protein kinase)
MEPRRPGTTEEGGTPNEEGHDRSPRAGPPEFPLEGRIGLEATLKLLYAGAPHAAAAARRVLGSLGDYLDPERLDDVLLLSTELVTNAIRHAGISEGGSVGLEVSVTPTVLRVEVADPGPGFELDDPEPDLERAGGWGLFLVDQLADRWGIERGEKTRVWFEIEREEAESPRADAA